jgi:hypothetical protein
VGLYIRSGLGFKVIAKSSESSGVEFLFVEIKLRNRVVLVATICIPPNTSVVYYLFGDDYGVQALDEICSNLLPLYGEVCLLGNFNVDLLDPGHSLFEGSWISWSYLCYAMWLFFRRKKRLANF